MYNMNDKNIERSSQKKTGQERRLPRFRKQDQVLGN